MKCEDVETETATNKSTGVIVKSSEMDALLRLPPSQKFNTKRSFSDGSMQSDIFIFQHSHQFFFYFNFFLNLKVQYLIFPEIEFHDATIFQKLKFLIFD